MTVRVAIVDDSPFVREILRAGLASHPDLEIVGEAADGATAERLVASVRPDVVTMDVVMPLVSGLVAIRTIMERTPTPIVVVSDARGGVDRLMIDAVAAGAVDVFVKPQRGFDETSAAALANILRSAAKAQVTPRRMPAAPQPRLDDAIHQVSSAAIIGVVASTGGPQALYDLIRALPPRFSIPIAIVQHTTIGLTDALVSWLAAGAPVPVTLARAGELARGIIVAPDDRHLTIDRRGMIVLTADAPVRGHRPSGTVLLESLAVHGRRAVGIVCTGMNDDGAAGLAAIATAGGVAIVQDPDTALIGAMPRAAIAATRAPLVASLPRIGELLRRAGGGS